MQTEEVVLEMRVLQSCLCLPLGPFENEKSVVEIGEEHPPTPAGKVL